VIEVDFHVHSLFSLCGLHTVLELLARARELGMKGFAVTDHGREIGGRLNSVFFERFVSPDPQVRILKGVECNVLDEKGGIDLPREFLQFIDIVLCGIHSNFPRGRTTDSYTDSMIAVIENNPQVDVVTHPNDTHYPVDYRRLAGVAARHGAVLELNNSKILYLRSTAAEACALLNACKEFGCRVAVSSDTHAIHELGDDRAVAPLLQETGFPRELIVNRDAAAAFSFIEERRALKR
jgi:putative hydrolase